MPRIPLIKSDTVITLDVAIGVLILALLNKNENISDPNLFSCIFYIFHSKATVNSALQIIIKTQASQQ